MKTMILVFLSAQFMLLVSINLFSQTNSNASEFGIAAGAFTNFPANQNYLKENMNVFYLAPYLRTGKHEFSAGLLYPLTTHGLYFTDSNINPRIGFVAGYKFYVFDVYGRENLFVHYSFQYLRFSGNFEGSYSLNNQIYHWTETDMYLNNVIGLGYNLFFDSNERFGFYYILDYVISQAGYKLVNPEFNGNAWATRYVWNNLSTNVGFIFKLTTIKKK